MTIIKSVFCQKKKNCEMFFFYCEKPSTGLSNSINDVCVWWFFLCKHKVAHDEDDADDADDDADDSHRRVLRDALAAAQHGDALGRARGRRVFVLFNRIRFC